MFASNSGSLFRLSRTPRVLMVVNDARFFVTHRLRLAIGLREAGFEVEVAGPDIGSAGRTIREAGIKLHLLPIERQGINPLSEVRAFVELLRLYRRSKPDLVHHVTVKPIIYGTIAARLARVPAVVNAISGLGILFSEDGALLAARSKVVRRVYRMAMNHPRRRLIFQTDHDRATFMAANVVSDDESVLVPGSGVDIRDYDPDVAPEEPPIVLLPARLLRRKGIREFVEAARTLKSRGSNARFVLAGDRADNRDAIRKSELEAWTQEGVVEAWGWVDDMPSAVERASIVCLPSYSEGIPKALLDACAAARPIVTTNTPGCADVVRDGFNGLLVPTRDSRSLANAIETLLEDEELRKRFGANGRTLVKERFDIQSVIRATVDTYASVLGLSNGLGVRHDWRANASG